MQGMTDRDIAYEILIGTKQTAAGYCQAALEAATPSCFRTFMELHERAQESHRRVWEFLHQRQEYQVSEAHPQEVQAVRDRMERLRDDHLHADGMRGDGRSWDRAGEMASTGRIGAGSGFRSAEWNGGPANGAGGSFAPGSGWERPGERRFEPSPAPRY